MTKKGYKLTEEQKRKISIANSNPSEETKRKMSEAKKGKSPWNKGLTKEIDERVKKYVDKRIGYKLSEETKEKIRKKLMGHSVSKETRIKIGKKNKGRHPKMEFKKGQIPWNKGKKGKVLSEETKRKIGDSHRGIKKGPMKEDTKEKIRKTHIGKKHKPHSEETKRKIGDKHKGRFFGGGFKLGNKNPVWKGGISKLRDRHDRTARYKKWRINIFQRDNWTCQTCGERGMQVHHIKSWVKYPKLRFEEDNGVTLCIECHKLTDNYGGKNNGL